jgi:hypothetical protein
MTTNISEMIPSKVEDYWGLISTSLLSIEMVAGYTEIKCKAQCSSGEQCKSVCCDSYHSFSGQMKTVCEGARVGSVATCNDPIIRECNDDNILVS